jgi:signal transduction histidine kinase
LASTTRARELEVLRQQISRDLHDEIGSSLGSISLITQTILADGGQSSLSRNHLCEIKQIADETVDAMRDITRLLQSERYGSNDLGAVVAETAGRMLCGIEHSVLMQPEILAQPLPVDRQRDLILMLKEMLHNIIRHAAATKVDICMEHQSSEFALTVRDNGSGFDPTAATAGMGLTNMRRRAAKHQGSAEVFSSPEGTTLIIKLPRHV